MTRMQIKHVSSLDDPSIIPFYSLKERTLASRHGLFVVEGFFLLQRLLLSPYCTQAILLEEKYIEKLSHIIPVDVQIYSCSKKLISQIAGFDFHRGVIALAARKPVQPIRNFKYFNTTSLLFVICPEINDVENLGVIMRNAAAFGVNAFIIGPRCCDPFARRALRASMGAAFQLPLFNSLNLENDLQWLTERFHFQFYAAVADGTASPLSQMHCPDHVGLLFGNEANGLDTKWIPYCAVRITIPMKTGVDSLNVAVASGIILHHFARQQTRIG
jgi:tRNA G18 (ribose-2'-O)-methylase SpoU